jgi:hypothetical protein
MATFKMFLFFTSPRPVLGPKTPTPIGCRGLFPRDKAAEVCSSPLASQLVPMSGVRGPVGSFPDTSSLRIKHGDNFTILFNRMPSQHDVIALELIRVHGYRMILRHSTPISFSSSVHQGRLWLFKFVFLLCMWLEWNQVHHYHGHLLAYFASPG